MSSVLTLDEAARELRISQGLLRKVITSGELPARRIGRRVVVAREAIDRYVQPAPVTRGPGVRR